MLSTVRISISFDAVRDAELLQWLAEQHNVSGVIREAVESFRKRESTIEARLTATEEKLDDLLALIRNLRVVEAQAEEPQTEGDEPTQARRGLEAMKKKFKR